jgi:putative molybdopterin biosynthesis protein
MKRNIYLQTVPLTEALAVVKKALTPKALIKSETIPAHKAAGRVTAQPIYAKLSSPTFHAAAMDGIAVNAEDTFAAREGNPLTMEAGTGFAAVNTGNPLPAGFNAVVMVENVVPEDADSVENASRVSIEAPAFPWQHVRRIGEDIVATELLLPRNHELSAYDVGALLSAGIWEVTVHERFKIRVIPTGDEVLDFTLRPEPEAGQVVESNSQVLASLAAARGLDVMRVPPVADDLDTLKAAVREALESDAHCVVIGAGSSAGSKDYTRAVMESFGQVLVHGVKAMPGKPTLLGVTSPEYGGKLMVGSPGYPVSAVIAYEELMFPIADWLLRRVTPKRPTVPVELTRNAPSKLGTEEFLRLSVGRVGHKYVGIPLARGAGMITTMTRAQAMARIPADSEGAEQGKTLDAELLVPENALEQVLVVVGSHDNTVDLLADALMDPANPEAAPVRLASTHVGSMGGIRAIAAGSCHMAGSHLFDPETKDYNFPFVNKYAPDADVVLVNLAIRHQGFIVPQGNPKKVHGIEDLAREDVRFINRQRGAGTRVLLDHHLKQAGIRPSGVNGYDKEEYTHMAVAVNVATGTVDCGLGVMAAAKALGLGFSPLARERYDLIIPKAHLDDPRVRAVLDLLADDGFKERIEAMGGYETQLTGQIMKPGTPLP